MNHFKLVLKKDWKKKGDRFSTNPYQVPNVHLIFNVVVVIWVTYPLNFLGTVQILKIILQEKFHSQFL